MKARVKATGYIVDVELYYITPRIKTYTDGSQHYKGDELDFNVEYTDPDYWTKLEHQYAGMAMQSYISNNVYLREIREMCKEPQEMRDLIADLSILLATSLVQKLKKK